jgi:hypothetical protein
MIVRQRCEAIIQASLERSEDCMRVLPRFCSALQSIAYRTLSQRQQGDTKTAVLAFIHRKNCRKYIERHHHREKIYSVCGTTAAAATCQYTRCSLKPCVRSVCSTASSAGAELHEYDHCCCSCCCIVCCCCCLK